MKPILITALVKAHALRKGDIILNHLNEEIKVARNDVLTVADAQPIEFKIEFEQTRDLTEEEIKENIFNGTRATFTRIIECGKDCMFTKLIR